MKQLLSILQGENTDHRMFWRCGICTTKNRTGIQICATCGRACNQKSSVKFDWQKGWVRTLGARPNSRGLLLGRRKPRGNDSQIMSAQAQERGSQGLRLFRACAAGNTKGAHDALHSKSMGGLLFIGADINARVRSAHNDGNCSFDSSRYLGIVIQSS